MYQSAERGENQYLDNNNVTFILDLLIPGTKERWPSAQESIDILKITGYENDYIKTLADDIARLPAEQRADALAASGAADAALFQSMLAMLYRLYYTSPPVLAVIAALAEAGPHELPRMSISHSSLRFLPAKPDKGDLDHDERSPAPGRRTGQPAGCRAGRDL